MHGPNSDDLMAELTSLRADFLMEFNHRSPGYGPGLVPTRTSASFARASPSLCRSTARDDFIARAFGPEEVADLDTLATAIYLTRENGSSCSVEGRARRLAELKPHVSFAQALDAVRECDRIAREAAAAEGP